MRLAILDDYQSAALNYGDWASLPKDVQIVQFTDHVDDEDQLVARLAEFDAICRIRERTPFTGRVLRRLPRLKLLLATGLRNSESIDMQAARELGITVCSTGAVAHPAIELGWLLILAVFRNFHTEIASFRAGGWQVGVGSSVRGKTLGILGLGRHGKVIAQIARLFGMQVLAWSPNLTPERAAEGGAELVGKADLFRRSDAVTIHMPLSARSRGIVGAAELALLREQSYLINVSRGELVDAEALVDALTNKRIAGYAVDVFAEEPLPRDHPFRYLPNVLATPHIGFVVEEFYDIIFTESVENLKAYLAGKPIRVLDMEGKLSGASH